MPRPKSLFPALTRHKASSRGVVRPNGADHYLGPWPDGRKEPPPETRAAYDRLIAEWLANHRRPVTPQDGTPNQVSGRATGIQHAPREPRPAAPRGRGGRNGRTANPGAVVRLG